MSFNIPQIFSSIARSVLNSIWKHPINKYPQEPIFQRYTTFFQPNHPDQSITRYFLNKKAEGKKTALIFAMGGGNDTFSALHIGKYLLDLDYKVMIYGVLGFTPFHSNETQANNLREAPITVPTSYFTRLLMMKTAKKISNTEHLLPSLLNSLDLDGISMKLLSSKYTPKQMAESVQEDVEKSGLFPKDILAVGLDFGADVITTGESTTFSPCLDATMLQMLSKLAYDKIAMICYPGVDGELSPDNLKHILEKLQSIAASQVNPMSEYVETLRKIYESLKNLRPGNTIPLILKVLENSKSLHTITESITKKHKVNKKNFVYKYPIQLDLSLASRMYLVSVENICKLNPFARIEYRDLLEYFIKIMKVYDGANSNNTLSHPYLCQKGTDFLLQFLRLDSDGQWTSKDLKDSKVMHVLVALASHPKEVKKEIINEGLNYLIQGGADLALLSAEQLRETGIDLNDYPVVALSAEKYLMVVPNKSDDFNLAEETCRKIISYQN